MVKLIILGINVEIQWWKPLNMDWFPLVLVYQFVFFCLYIF